MPQNNIKYLKKNLKFAQNWKVVLFVHYFIMYSREREEKQTVWTLIPVLHMPLMVGLQFCILVFYPHTFSEPNILSWNILIILISDCSKSSSSSAAPFCKILLLLSCFQKLSRVCSASEGKYLFLRFVGCFQCHPSLSASVRVDALRLLCFTFSAKCSVVAEGNGGMSNYWKLLFELYLILVTKRTLELKSSWNFCFWFIGRWSFCSILLAMEFQ